jgi:uncharacterized membrane protein HdeD (DUF308 family)
VLLLTLSNHRTCCTRSSEYCSQGLVRLSLHALCYRYSALFNSSITCLLVSAMMTNVVSRLVGRLTQTATAGWQVQVSSDQIKGVLFPQSKARQELGLQSSNQ